MSVPTVDMNAIKELWKRKNEVVLKLQQEWANPNRNDEVFNDLLACYVELLSQVMLLLGHKSVAVAAKDVAVAMRGKVR